MATKKAAKKPAKKISKTLIINREHWLNEGIKHLTPIFKDAGHPLPAGVKVSCSWPGGGSARKRIGECWAKKMSKANINEIFISPMISDPVIALDILAHELVHAVDDCANGHKHKFQVIANAVGVNKGKPTQARANDELRAKLEQIAKKIGAYPHSTIDLSSRKKKGTYLVKCQCTDDDCGAIFRMTTSWIDRAAENGMLCPVCGNDAEASE